jgi:hypothetical protein
LRTIDEIAAWSALDDAAKRVVWTQLALRRRQWRHQREAIAAQKAAAAALSVSAGVGSDTPSAVHPADPANGAQCGPPAFPDAEVPVSAPAATRR